VADPRSTPAKPTGVGLVGSGMISAEYLATLARMPFLRLVACADLDPARAEVAAAAANAEATSVDELLERDDVEVVLNLTPPLAHAAAMSAAIEAGKHAYGEKPLATDRDAAAELVDAAVRRGLRLGCAPDTFLGPAWQKARELVDAGAIGRPVAARATFLSRGMEGWHPNPWFFYQQGGGPLLDVGPYYLTALASLVGPVQRVSGAARISFPTRIVTSPERAGEVIEVTTPTHIAALLEFEVGAIGTLVTSFDVFEPWSGAIELYGSDGSLHLPDPNNFDGMIYRRGADVENPWERILTTGREPRKGTGHRGIGLADMVLGLREGREHRASGELAFHVLDVMLSVLESATTGQAISIRSTCRLPAPLDDATKTLLWPREWLPSGATLGL
jgi:predicted dehydrogenase